ncbi:MAG: HindIII family type II restriction endonuclease [Raineya sp.]|nr:HindIII family type II restriction endonuclease [Raineya sp.]
MLNKERIEKRRQKWIQKIAERKEKFADISNWIRKEIDDEIAQEGSIALLEHIRMCGNIPENYQTDSTEEKIYSKYTDNLIAVAYRQLGMQAIVLDDRSDSADVEVFTSAYSFVADAKSFRLSRTAKNQKDFKVEAMHSWKRGKPYAMIVCPIYQLPNKSSQIYQQAIIRNVCIFTYSHLAILLSFAQLTNFAETQKLLLEIFQTISALHPSKSANDYWLGVNRTILKFSPLLEKLWQAEKGYIPEIIKIAQNEALTFVAKEREKILQMSHQEALTELMKIYQIERRMQTIKNIFDNQLLNLIQ